MIFVCCVGQGEIPENNKKKYYLETLVEVSMFCLWLIVVDRVVRFVFIKLKHILFILFIKSSETLTLHLSLKLVINSQINITKY